MKTTALRIEILIIGFQSSIWAMFIFGFSISDVFEYIKGLKDVAALSTVVLLGWCYSFGAAIDGVTGAIEDPKSLLYDVPQKDSSTSILWLKFPETSKELMQSYFDLRLLRATAFNLLMYSFVSFYSGHPMSITFVAIISSILVGLSWWRRRKRISKRKERLCAEASKMNTDET